MQVRLTCAMRSSTGGGLTQKAKARAGKPLSGSANGSKSQLHVLCAQVNERGSAYTGTALRKRKADGLAQRLGSARVNYDAVRKNLAECHVWHRRRTCYDTEGGKKRKAAPTAIGCIPLLGEPPAPGTIIKKGRGNYYKGAAQLKAGRATMALKTKELSAAKKRQGQTMARMHGTGRQERRAADAAAKQPRPGIGPQKKGAKRQKKSVAAVRVVAEESEGDEESEVEGDGAGLIECEGEEGEGDTVEEQQAAEIAVLRAENAVLRVARPAAPLASVLPLLLPEPELGEIECLRLKLKAFEHEFLAAHKRKPSLADTPRHMLTLYAEYKR